MLFNMSSTVFNKFIIMDFFFHQAVTEFLMNARQSFVIAYCRMLSVEWWWIFLWMLHSCWWNTLQLNQVRHYSLSNVMMVNKKSPYLINGWDVATKVIPLCLVFCVLSYDSNLTWLAWFCPVWPVWACYLFLNWPELPTVQTSWRINNMLK